MSRARDELIARLGLVAHPEGGHWCRSYMDAATDGARAAWSGIYYLLSGAEKSHLHRLDADELWCVHAGDALEITIILADGTLTKEVLGTDLARGEKPQVLCPKNCIFGAQRLGNSGWSLVGCIVVPGYEAGQFELMPRSEMLRLYPVYREDILRLTRDDAQ